MDPLWQCGHTLDLLLKNDVYYFTAKQNLFFSEICPLSKPMRSEAMHARFIALLMPSLLSH